MDLIRLLFVFLFPLGLVVYATSVALELEKPRIVSFFVIVASFLVLLYFYLSQGGRL